MTVSGVDAGVLKQLAEQARHGSLVLFVGAGASRAAGLPTWKELLAPLEEQLALPPEADRDLLDVPQWYADVNGRPALEHYVRQELIASKKSKEPSELHRALARVPAPVIFTTNFDTLMETALEKAQGVPPDVIIEDAHVGLIDEARRTTLVKMHGCVTLPSTIVLTRDDFEAYGDRHPAITAYLQSLLATRTFLFVGYSLVDQNFRSIYAAIRRALGTNRRRAYVVISDPPSPATAYWQAYWRQRGILGIQQDSHDAVPTFVQDLAAKSKEGTTAAEAIRTLRATPSLHVQRVAEQLEGLHGAMQELISRAADEDLLPSGLVPVDRPVAKPPMSEQDRARALLNLAEAIDRVVPLDDPSHWVALGDLLYEQGVADRAIRAYHAALRPLARQDRSALPDGLPESVTLRVRGNLARAHGQLGDHARAEWLLRRCVFLEGQDVADERFDRTLVHARLRLDHLESRPTDAAELVHAITRRVEQWQQAGQLAPAFDALREARYLLEPLLGIGARIPGAAPAQDVFGDQPIQPRRYHTRGLSALGRPYHPKAWAMNFLGKCYRQSAEVALDLGRSGVGSYCHRAARYLGFASNLDPLLPYPYAHRVLLLRNPRLPGRAREELQSSLGRDLKRLIGEPGGDRLLGSLRRRLGNDPLLRPSA